MAPLSILRNEDEGKTTIRVSNWLVPIILSLMTFVAGAFATSIRLQDTVANHTAEIKNLQETTKGIQPADNLVTQREFKATMDGMKAQLNLMNDNINRLLTRNK